MDYLNFFLSAYESLGRWGYWVILVFSLLESLVFVGLFVPGMFVVLFVGFASANGVLDLGDLIWFVAIGGIIGDSLSYYLGTKGTKFFRLENKFLKYSHLEKGKEFFRQHGNKSIFLGRFIGPLRSIVPFIAGLTRMKKEAFLFWNITSGFVWATTILLLGYFFGQAAKVLEVWITRMGTFLLILGGLAIFLWFLKKKLRWRPHVDFQG